MARSWSRRNYAPMAVIGPWQKPRSPPGTAAYWGTAATKGTSAVVRSPDGVHAPRHGRRRRPTKLERTSETVEPDRDAMALRSPMWSTGSLRIVPIRAPPASRNSPPSRINHACVPATAPRIWPSYATSLSIWFAKSQTNDPSSDAASAPPGTQNICLKYWGRRNVNLDSLPWVRPRCGLLAGRGGLLCFGLAAIQQWRRIIIHANR